jgi:hypothetical protein
MTDGPRTPATAPVAPNTAPGAPATDGSLPAGVDSIGEGFEGSTVMKTTGDDNPSSIQPQEPLPENATETEKQLVEDNEDK